MASKGIIVSAGVVDAGYRGEIVVCMTLLNTKARYGFKDWEALEYSNLQPLSTGALAANPGYLIAAGDKIAQMIPIPVLTGEVKEVEEFDETARGSSGFGSTGR
jgi:dUTP pyrophosphatase